METGNRILYKVHKLSTVTIHGVLYVRPMCCSFGDYHGSGDVERANILSILRMATGVAELTPGLCCTVGYMRNLSANYIYNHTPMDWVGDEHHKEKLPPAHLRQPRFALVGEPLRDIVEETIQAAGKAPGVIHCIGSHGSEEVWIAEWFDEEHNVIEELSDYPCLDDELHTTVQEAIHRYSWENYLCADLRSELVSRLVADEEDRVRAVLTPDEALDAFPYTDEQLWKALHDVMAEVGDYGEIENSSWAVNFNRIRHSRILEILKGAQPANHNGPVSHTGQFELQI